MSHRDMYAFEHGSGLSWVRYLVPADQYTLHKDSKGELYLISVVTDSCYFKSVSKLRPIGGEEFCAEVQALIDTKPKE